MMSLRCWWHGHELVMQRSETPHVLEFVCLKCDARVTTQAYAPSEKLLKRLAHARRASELQTRRRRHGVALVWRRGE